MRGVHSAVDDIRRNVFTEVARLAYESDDYKQVDMIPYKIVPGEVAHHRHDVFLERAIVSARLKLALGMDLDPNGPSAPISANIQDAATDQKYFNEPLVNIIPYACNACPPKQVRITDSCQGCISHPCMNVCPKDAIYLDENKRCHIDQSKCIKCGKCFNQCPYRAISKIERPCAAACGMDAIESDELNYEAVKSQIQKLIAQAASSQPQLSFTGFACPLKSYSRISSEYGWRKNPVSGVNKLHAGIDLAAGGGTPIYAAASGYVQVAGWSSGGYGNYVIIYHGKMSDGNQYSTLYGHMRSVATSAGKYVQQGEIIGYVGSTGNSTGNHLHLEVWKGGSKANAVNPRGYIPMK